MARAEAESHAPPSDVGTQCSLGSCRALDFLPLTCPGCSSPFCRHHASPASHACPSGITAPSSPPSSRRDDGPELRDLLPPANRNALSTGIHSQAPANSTAAPRTAPTKQQLALAALKRSIDAKKKPSPSLSSAASPATRAGGQGGAVTPKDKKPNPTLELMKLKQRAKSADPSKRDGDVPMLDRWYLLVKYVEGPDQTDQGMREVWVQKMVSAGKALDLFADLFKVINVNHLANADPTRRLNLALPTAPQLPVNLANRIDQVVANGSTILLCRGATA